MKKEIQIANEKETKELARRIGESLKGGEVFALNGNLGAGKTCFVQGLASGLEVPPSVYVRSPTFTLWDTYPGRLNLEHFDLYRLSDEDELEALGWREALSSQSVVAIEWAERVPGFLPSSHIQVEIDILSAEKRTFCFLYDEAFAYLEEAF